VTVIKGGPCYVTQIKSEENCGYNAIQIGYLEISPNAKRLTKPNLGHFNKSKFTSRYLKEYKILESSNYEVGQQFGLKCLKLDKQLQ
jgi:large subunit ribosomal protein L3